MLEIAKSRRFDADVDEIVLYFLDVFAYDAAERFGDAVDETLRWVSDFPETGEEMTRSFPSPVLFKKVQVRGFPNYLIYVRKTETFLRAVRLLHASRNVDPDIFPELPT